MNIKTIARKTTRRVSEAGLVWLSYAHINPAYAQRARDVDPDSPPTGITEGIGQADQGGPRSLFADGGVFDRIVSAVLFLVGAFSVLMLIVGGVRYVMSAGNPDQAQSAKNTIIYALIGLAIALLAYAIVQFIIGQLSGPDPVGTQ